MGFTILGVRDYTAIGVTVSNVYITNKNSWNCRKNTDGKSNITSTYYGYTTSDYNGKVPIEYGSVNLVLDSNPEDFQDAIYTEIKTKMGLESGDYEDDL